MRNKRETSILDLHESLIINILTFLPLEFIIRCSSVCKTWSTLISQPYFAHLYYSTQRSSKSSSPIQFLLQHHKKPNKLYLAQLGEASCSTTSEYMFPTKYRFLLKFLDPADTLLKICTTCRLTGCIVGYRFDEECYRSDELYHIFNPVTGDYIVIQQSIKKKLQAKENCALVFVQRTNQLKLLIFLSNEYLRESVEIDIQTLDNTNSWRTIGNLPFNPDEFQFPTFVNELYHWMQHKKQVIYSFDPDTEEFQQIPTPEHNYAILHCTSNLGVLDSRLCVCIRSKGSGYREFWVMNEYGIRESWTKMFVICNDFTTCSARILEPIRYSENGDIIILSRYHNGISYNPTTRSCKYIRFDAGDPDSLRYKPFPFIPSLRRVLPS